MATHLIIASEHSFKKFSDVIFRHRTSLGINLKSLEIFPGSAHTYENFTVAWCKMDRPLEDPWNNLGSQIMTPKKQGLAKEDNLPNQSTCRSFLSRMLIVRTSAHRYSAGYAQMRWSWSSYSKSLNFDFQSELYILHERLGTSPILPLSKSDGVYDSCWIVSMCKFESKWHLAACERVKGGQIVFKPVRFTMTDYSTVVQDRVFTIQALVESSTITMISWT